MHGSIGGRWATTTGRQPAPYLTGSAEPARLPARPDTGKGLPAQAGRGLPRSWGQYSQPLLFGSKPHVGWAVRKAPSL